MVSLLGIPFDANSSFLKGAAFAPQRIRLMEREGSANPFSETGLDISPHSGYVDLGDLSFPSPEPQKAFDIIKTGVTEALRGDNPLICLGGDHSVSWPVIEAFAEKYRPLHVLHFDAHGDLYELFDNNLYSHASPFARILEKGLIDSLTQVGIRTYNTHQREQLSKYGVKAVEMKDYSTEFIQTLKGPLYISLDLDVLDPAFVPGISHYEPGGMSVRQLIDALHLINLPIVGADIVEYNPARDRQDMTAMVAYKLFKELAAKMR